MVELYPRHGGRIAGAGDEADLCFENAVDRQGRVHTIHIAPQSDIRQADHLTVNAGLSHRADRQVHALDLRVETVGYGKLIVDDKHAPRQDSRVSQLGHYAGPIRVQLSQSCFKLQMSDALKAQLQSGGWPNPPHSQSIG